MMKNKTLTFLLIPLYFGVAWLFPWEEIQIDSTISVAYLWDFLFFILVSFLLGSKPKLAFSKNILIRIPIIIAMSSLCIAITHYAKLDAPFRYLEHLALQIIFLGPLFEEVVYRHGIYEILNKLNLKKNFQYFLGAMLFSLGHAQALLFLSHDFHAFIYFQLVYTFFLGWVCIKARERTGSVFEPIILHMIFNYLFWLAVSKELI